MVRILRSAHLQHRLAFVICNGHSNDLESCTGTCILFIAYQHTSVPENRNPAVKSKDKSGTRYSRRRSFLRDLVIPMGTYFARSRPEMLSEELLRCGYNGGIQSKVTARHFERFYVFFRTGFCIGIRSTTSVFSSPGILLRHRPQLQETTWMFKLHLRMWWCPCQLVYAFLFLSAALFQWWDRMRNTQCRIHC